MDRITRMPSNIELETTVDEVELSSGLRVSYNDATFELVVSDESRSALYFVNAGRKLNQNRRLNSEPLSTPCLTF